MSADLERELREMLQHRAGEVAWTPVPTRGLLRRARRRRVTVASVAMVALLAVAGTVPLSQRWIESRRVDFAPANPGADTSPFVGTWVSIDSDGSSQTMEVLHEAGDEYKLIIRDAFATACSGAPATMTGGGVSATDEQLVFARPRLTCDDGARPEIGPAPQLELANFTLDLDTEADELVDSLEVVWHRPGANDQSATSGGMWPQLTLDEVRAAQDRADAGDPAVTWQLDAGLAAVDEPWGAEIFTRFITEQLGWEEFVSGSVFSFYGYAASNGNYSDIAFIRCAPGQTNPLAPLYDEVPRQIRGCAPTIDEFTYETVSISVTQPERGGASGLWVVNRWALPQATFAPRVLAHLIDPDFEMRQVSQVVPPSDAEASELLEAFLEARVAGKGAEQYLLREPAGSWNTDEDVPVMYAASSGAAYDRFEIDRLQGPVWPTGWVEYEVTLVADDGSVIEQRFHLVRHDRQLGLIYGESDRPTTENGQPVAVRQTVLDGSVTVTAPPLYGFTRDVFLLTDIPGSEGRLIIASDVRLDCSKPAPSDARALARDIEVDPAFEFIGGGSLPIDVDGVQLDVAFSEVTETGCPVPWMNPPGGPDWRMRLYLIDNPDESASPYLKVLTIGVLASEAEFERAVEQAAPILESLEIHPG